jgi:hypothetical protein
VDETASSATRPGRPTDGARLEGEPATCVAELHPHAQAVAPLLETISHDAVQRADPQIEQG